MMFGKIKTQKHVYLMVALLLLATEAQVNAADPHQERDTLAAKVHLQLTPEMKDYLEGIRILESAYPTKDDLDVLNRANKAEGADAEEIIPVLWRRTI